ncbi:MAG: magnesium chelatase subunit D [Pseudomonadota bacterium]
MAAAADEARWADASLAAALLAIDPRGLGGAWVHAGATPARAAWLALLRALLPEAEPLRKIPQHAGEDRLLGGLDLAATLAAGRPVAQRGLLAEADGGLVLLAMAERLPASTVAHACAALDAGEVVLERQGLAQCLPARIGAVALDESLADEEPAAAALRDRLGFWIDLEGLRADEPDAAVAPADVVAARGRLAKASISEDLTRALCVTALQLGIASLRAVLFAQRAAIALAALDGREVADEDDAAAAARLVFAARATVLPQAPDEEPPAEPPPPEPPQDGEPPPDDPDRDASERKAERPPEELLVAAALAAMPPGLLARLALGGPRLPARGGGKAGAAPRSRQRGRPLGARRGEPRRGARLALVDTLRAAAPWQPLRRRTAGGDAARVHVRRDDFHVVRYRQRTPTTTIFVVDASGSAALNRLAEAKGAVELLLAECYVRRDQVAVIAFRGQAPELLLPPTRSLVRAKRSLAGLPGGLGTPLAGALDAATALALQVRRAGHAPTVVLLTDGQANVARDGTPGRERAEADALAAARALRAANVATLFVDIAPRANPKAARLATAMGARYLALPHADARALSSVVIAATGTDGRR